MSLAAASRDLGRRCVCRDQASRKFDASVDKPVSALAKFGAGPNLRNIVLHVLGRPATTVSDKWKLRKREAKLSKEHQHLADHRTCAFRLMTSMTWSPIALCNCSAQLSCPSISTWLGPSSRTKWYVAWRTIFR